MLEVSALYEEVAGYLADIDVIEDTGEHIYSNYRKVTAYAIRLTEIRNQIAFLEIVNEAPPELRKFRTMILDKTIERLEEIARYESRKITAMGLEMNLDKGNT
jgi:hypothetical protein